MLMGYEMDANSAIDATIISTDTALDAGCKQRKRRRSAPRKSLDGRTWIAKRMRVLREHYLSALGDRNLTVDLEGRISKAAELSALAEDLRARMLRGERDVCADDLVRMQRLADASVRALGLDRKREADRPKGQTLGALLTRTGR